MSEHLDTHSRRRAAPRRELVPLGWQRSGVSRKRGGTPKGAAVVLAMLVAALAAAIAATVFADQQRWSRTVENRRDQVQAQALAMAGVQWARQILYDDLKRSTLDHLGEPWAMSLPPVPLENGEIRGAIADAQARLNINALGGPGTQTTAERTRIERLFAQRGGPVAAIDAIADWIDADLSPRPNGAEDARYAALPAPGLTANAPIIRVAELSQVIGVSAPALERVVPFLSALPMGTPTNVNTAAPEVLAAIVESLSSDGQAALISRRAQRPFATLADFRSSLPQGATLASEESLSVKSDNFYVTIEAREGRTFARARALLHRSTGQWPTVIWQVVE
ncbi:MAG TPA: type II secretion system minor pseudopilin GspK [Casimicrobiaceae bacterium]